MAKKVTKRDTIISIALYAQKNAKELDGREYPSIKKVISAHLDGEFFTDACLRDALAKAGVSYVTIGSNGKPASGSVGNPSRLLAKITLALFAEMEKQIGVEAGSIARSRSGQAMQAMVNGKTEEACRHLSMVQNREPPPDELFA